MYASRRRAAWTRARGPSAYPSDRRRPSSATRIVGATQHPRVARGREVSADMLEIVEAARAPKTDAAHTGEIRSTWLIASDSSRASIWRIGELRPRPRSNDNRRLWRSEPSRGALWPTSPKQGVALAFRHASDETRAIVNEMSLLKLALCLDFGLINSGAPSQL